MFGLSRPISAILLSAVAKFATEHEEMVLFEYGLFESGKSSTEHGLIRSFCG
jgi:hypothetical protein